MSKGYWKIGEDLCQNITRSNTGAGASSLLNAVILSTQDSLFISSIKVKKNQDFMDFIFENLPEIFLSSVWTHTHTQSENLSFS